MAEEISLEKIYWEIKDLKKEVDLVFHALVPEEKIGKEEVEELKHIEAEMKRGEKIKLRDALAASGA